METPGDHHVVETKEGVSYLVEYDQERGKGKETTGDHYQLPDKNGEAKTKAKTKNDDKEEEEDDEVVMAEEVKVNKKEKKSDGEERYQRNVENHGELPEIVQDTQPEEKNVEDDDEEVEDVEVVMDSNEDYGEPLDKPLEEPTLVPQILENGDKKGKGKGRKRKTQITLRLQQWTHI